jgi:ribonucleoside-diphosphate reductase alpha chain
VPEDLRRLFVTAHDITPEWHVRMQAAFQEFTDNAVSKTVNFPEGATPEQVAQAYLLAYDLGCKGITIFRYGTREAVLNLPADSEPSPPDKKEPRTGKLIEPSARYNELRPRERPAKLLGSTELLPIGCGKLYITINRDELGLCELFTSPGRTGGCPSQSEAISRLVSLALRTGIAVDELTHQLSGIRCHSAMRRNELLKNGLRAVSCPAAVGLALEMAARKFANGSPKAVVRQLAAPAVAEPDALQIHRREADWLARGLCPDCQTPIEREGGCLVCRSCGFSKCG